ncbi:hypothetical protein GCM10020218_043000 [Dactylosporangium vinaceum]
MAPRGAPALAKTMSDSTPNTVAITPSGTATAQILLRRRLSVSKHSMKAPRSRSTVIRIPNVLRQRDHRDVAVVFRLGRGAVCAASRIVAPSGAGMVCRDDPGGPHEGRDMP